MICISSICSNVCRDRLSLKVGAAIKWIWGISWLCREHSSHENAGNKSEDTGNAHNFRKEENIRNKFSLRSLSRNCTDLLVEIGHQN